MEKIKSALLLIIFLGIIAAVGYWALFTLEPGSIHVDRQRQEELEEENEELKSEIEGLKSEIRILTEEKDAQIAASEEPAVEEPTTYKNQSLINEIEKLISDGIIMKEKSQGTRVGTLQNFLNLYNGTSKRVDNDFGAGTKEDLIKFQKGEGITADGEAGPGTYRKMIEWLKKQG